MSSSKQKQSASKKKPQVVKKEESSEFERESSVEYKNVSKPNNYKMP
jgi:hypothetical protein